MPPARFFNHQSCTAKAPALIPDSLCRRVCTHTHTAAPPPHILTARGCHRQPPPTPSNPPASPRHQPPPLCATWYNMHDSGTTKTGRRSLTGRPTAGLGSANASLQLKIAQRHTASPAPAHCRPASMRQPHSHSVLAVTVAPGRWPSCNAANQHCTPTEKRVLYLAKNVIGRWCPPYLPQAAYCPIKGPPLAAAPPVSSTRHLHP